LIPQTRNLANNNNSQGCVTMSTLHKTKGESFISCGTKYIVPKPDLGFLRFYWLVAPDSIFHARTHDPATCFISHRFMEPARMLTGGPLRAAPPLWLLVGALLRCCPSLPPRPPVLASLTALCRCRYMGMASMSWWMLWSWLRCGRNGREQRPFIAGYSIRHNNQRGK
jgi:hypothetical protein